jgi:hypothetical protein
MKIQNILWLSAILALSGCATIHYTPQEYPLRDGLIKPTALVGSLTINNVQTLTDEVIVHSYMGNKFGSDYKSITALMVNQTKKEAEKNLKAVNSDKKKTIDLEVVYLKSRYIAYFWKSELKYKATLDGSIVIEKDVHHASGSVFQDLNGCIAEAVIDLLNDPKVTAYLGE